MYFTNCLFIVHQSAVSRPNDPHGAALRDIRVRTADDDCILCQLFK